MFNEIDLVDDIDQALRFDHAPEHLVHTQAQFPFIITDAAEQQQIGFTQVYVGTARVRGVVTKKRRQGEASALDVLNVELRLQDKAACVGTLAGIQGGFRIPAAIDTYAAGKFVVGNFNPCACP